VPDSGLTAHAAAQPLLQLAIRAGYAIVLTKVLRPGTHDKGFEITVGGLEVPANSPARRAVPASDTSVLVHGLDKVRRQLGIDVVFHGDEDRAARIDVHVDDSGQAPMIPRCQIDTHVRQSFPGQGLQFTSK